MALSPGCVTGVCERQVTDPQLVHGAQGSQAAVQGVAALHADQASRLVHAEGLRDVCGHQHDRRWRIKRPTEAGGAAAADRVSPSLVEANMKTSGYF